MCFLSYVNRDRVYFISVISSHFYSFCKIISNITSHNGNVKNKHNFFPYEKKKNILFLVSEEKRRLPKLLYQRKKKRRKISLDIILSIRLKNMSLLAVFLPTWDSEDELRFSEA